MPIILGIDPGSLKTGYGLIQQRGATLQYVTSGLIRLQSDMPLSERLGVIFANISEIIESFQPDQFAIENVFLAKNASSALKLGQARGAAIVAAVSKGLEVSEYDARKIKQSVVGNGAADKVQVQHMVKTLLKLPAPPKEDAADALAVSLCHANTYEHMVRMSGARHYRRGRVV